MAISQNFPTIVPSLNLNFAKTKILDSRITFSRASTGTYVDSDGLIKSAATGQARFDHTPTTGESLGLLVEEARTNLVTYSEQFNDASWGNLDSTVTANSGLAPDGNITADIFTATTSTGYLYKGTSITAASYTISVYVKPNTATTFRLDFATIGLGTGATCLFNLSTGTAGTVTNYGSSSGFVASIQSLPNGWYRCALTGTATAAVWYHELTLLSNSGNSIYVWGAQLEAGSFPTSYIPTTTATVTRAADVASITGTNFSSWYNQSQGTLLSSVRTNCPPSVSNGMIFKITDGTVNNRIELQQVQSGDAWPRISGLFRYLNTTTATFTNQETNWQFNGLSNDTVALSFDSSSFTLSSKFDSTPATGSGSFSQSLTNIVLAHTGTYSRFTYWPTRLSDAILQNITK